MTNITTPKRIIVASAGATDTRCERREFRGVHGEVQTETDVDHVRAARVDHGRTLLDHNSKHNGLGGHRNSGADY